MSMRIKEIIIVLVYALGMNMLLLSFANMGIGIDCSNLQEEYTHYNQTYNLTDSENQELKTSSASIIDLALGRCEGMPYWLFIILELPIIVGLLYIIRGFIGAT